MVFEDKFVLDSGLKGPSLIILGGVHGNETCGVEAIRQIKNSLEIKNGKVTFVIVNKKAIEQNKRFVEYDLNRSFDKEFAALEVDIANELKPLLLESEALLDLHASTSKTEPYAISETLMIVNKLPVKKALLGLEKVHKGSTDEYMYKNGKIGICVECGYLNDSNSVKVAIKSIKAFLAAFDMINYPITLEEQEITQVKGIYKNKGNFILAKDYEDFELIKAGNTIGTDSGKEIKFSEDIRIFFASNKKEPDSECFVYGEKITNHKVR